MRQKLLLTLFALCIPWCAWADVEINGIYYNLVQKAKIAEVTNGGTTGRYSGDIVIPASVEYEGVTYSVTTISSKAFYDCYSLYSVVIPNSVTTIGSEAFANCSRLTSVEIPNSLKSIGGAAFALCYAINKVIIHDIGAWCGITIGDSYHSPIYYSNPLWNGGHIYCDENTEVTELVIPDGVIKINSDVFYGCSNLTSVVIPNSVTTIGSEAFSGCSRLPSVEIPNSVTNIGSSAFLFCI